MGAAHKRLLSALGVSAALHAALALSIGHLPAIATESMAPSPSLTVTLVSAAAGSANQLTQKQLPDIARPDIGNAGPMPKRTSAAALPPAKYYFSSREVDSPAEAINDVLLRYPRRAFANGIAGEVRLRLLIDENGVVDEAKLVDSEPAEIFDAAAIAAAIQLRYRPAIKDGRVVRSQKTIAIVFDPSIAPLEEETLATDTR